MNKCTALITGVTGQDGAYLAKLLIEKNYNVIGCYRRTSTVNFWRLESLGIKNNDNLTLTELDLTDSGNILKTIEKYEPDEVYNLAAQSFVGISFDQPSTTAEITALGALNILEAIKLVNKKIKFYQASSSEMFGKVQSVPQNEKTPFYPRSPYGVSKLFAHWMTVNYREAYNIFASSGILFNHESPLRGTEFVTRKITHSISLLKSKKIDYFELGNLNSKRDWGFAGDYVEGMWRMLQIEKPDTFVLATGQTFTIREFLEISFKHANFDVEFIGNGVNETVVDKKNNKTIVKINPKFYRPTEVDLLVGDFSRAKEILGWEPKINIDELSKMMISYDMGIEKT